MTTEVSAAAYDAAMEVFENWLEASTITAHTHTDSGFDAFRVQDADGVDCGVITVNFVEGVPRVRTLAFTTSEAGLRY